jgi:transcriptional regulator with XRE-family HTH domain
MTNYTSGKKLRLLRAERDMTQVELAAASGVTQTAISAIERDDTTSPAYDTAVRIARALGVAPDAIWGPSVDGDGELHEPCPNCHDIDCICEGR